MKYQDTIHTDSASEVAEYLFKCLSEFKSMKWPEDSSFDDFVVYAFYSNFEVFELINSDSDNVTEVSFAKKFVVPIKFDKSVDPENYAIEVCNKTSKIDLDTRNNPLATSCVFLALAIQAALKNDHEVKWKYLAEARYWSGVYSAFSEVPSVIHLAREDMKSDNARKGGKERAKAKYKDIKDKAYELVIKEMPINKWPSRRQAVLRIKNDVLDYAKKVRNPLSEDNAAVTIDGWLKNMSGIENYIKKK